MNFKLLRAYFQLVRPVNVLFTFVAVSIAGWLAGATWGDIRLIFIGGVCAASVVAGANALNDYFDIEIDRINKPQRPLPLGTLSLEQAKRLWFILSLTAMFTSILLPIASTIIVVFAIGTLYLYSKYWKKTVLIGNTIVALLTGLTFIFGGSMLGNYKGVWIPALFAFLSNFARELVKDIEDIKGDYEYGAITLPVRYGVLSSRILITFTILVILVLSYLVVNAKVYSWFFALCVIAANLLFCIGCIRVWQYTDERTMNTVSVVIKVGMGIGMLGILGGSLQI
ncbi:MAG: geranylgeranylglycerol-phosphate geranylgeranyltransferase [Bacteroidetes bacterium]|nr:geranylgeranylglycerol-phosphate geranylgeranyltransferase [Bacteroidota bacterium]